MYMCIYIYVLILHPATLQSRCSEANIHRRLSGAGESLEQGGAVHIAETVARRTTWAWGGFLQSSCETTTHRLKACKHDESRGQSQCFFMCRAMRGSLTAPIFRA